MATELKKVEPGELIKSDFINSIIDHLLDLTAKVSGLSGTGTSTVPNLFGNTLDTAMGTITQPQINLKLGNVLDAYGAVLDPDLPEIKQRLVINQYPLPGQRVEKNVSVNLLVAAKPEASNGGGTPAPILDITGFNPQKPRIGEEVTIIGKNFFMTDITKNKVTIGGKSAGVPKSNKDTELTVTVPDVDNPPTGATEKPFSVKVESPNGTDTMDIILRAKAEDLMTVTKFAGVAIQNGVPTSTVFIKQGNPFEIEGTNFSSNRQENTISFDTDTNIKNPEDGSTTTLLKVIVPTITGLNASNPQKIITVKINVKGKNTVSFTGIRATL